MIYYEVIDGVADRDYENAEDIINALRKVLFHMS